MMQYSSNLSNRKYKRKLIKIKIDLIYFKEGRDRGNKVSDKNIY